MKLLSTLLIAVLLGAVAIALNESVEGQPAPEATPAPEPDAAPDLGFLTGHWRAQRGRMTMEEHWFPPVHGTTTGMLRMYDPQGNHTMLELLTFIPNEQGEMIYRMRHFDGMLEPWESEKDGPFEGVVAEHAPGRLVIRTTKNHRDTETMTYEAVAEDTLRVTIRFNQLSSRETIVIDFTRVN